MPDTLGHHYGPAPRGHEIGLEKRPKPKPLEPTPKPWFILNVGGKEFVAADATKDHPYYGKTRFIDIAGDEDYPRKKADMELIVSLRNASDK